MSEDLFDDRAHALHRERAIRRCSAPFLAERIVHDLADRLTPVRRGFARALVTGCPPILQPTLAHVAHEVMHAGSIDALASLAEESVDLLLVIGELDARDHLPLLLQVARSRVQSGGLLAGALAGGNTLPALRQALARMDRERGQFAPRVHPRIEPGALAGLLGAAGFGETVVDIDRIALRYGSLSRLVSDLRDHGATNCLRARDRRGLSRAEVALAADAFMTGAVEGRVAEQVEILHFSAWAKNQG